MRHLHSGLKGVPGALYLPKISFICGSGFFSTIKTAFKNRLKTAFNNKENE